MHFDEFSLATATRDAGLADGYAALSLAAALLVRFATRNPVDKAEIEGAATQSEFANDFANVWVEP